jgi:hypothetical protein
VSALSRIGEWIDLAREGTECKFIGDSGDSSRAVITPRFLHFEPAKAAGSSVGITAQYGCIKRPSKAK